MFRIEVCFIPFKLSENVSKYEEAILNSPLKTNVPDTNADNLTFVNKIYIHQK